MAPNRDELDLSNELQECTIPRLKDLIHICLEQEVQGCGVTFNMCYVDSKYPDFILYRGK